MTASRQRPALVASPAQDLIDVVAVSDRWEAQPTAEQAAAQAIAATAAVLRTNPAAWGSVGVALGSSVASIGR